MTIWPGRVPPGATLGIWAPSSPSDPARRERGLEWLAREGFQTRVMPSALVERGLHAGSAQQRADELLELFLDPEVAAIVCLRGGSGCLPVLDLLNFEQIQRNPKWIIGLSDPTALLLGLFARTGMISLSGQVLVQLHAGAQRATQERWRQFLAGDWPSQLPGNMEYDPPWEVPTEDSVAVQTERPGVDVNRRDNGPGVTKRRSLPGAWRDPQTGFRDLVALVPGTAEGPLLPANLSLLTRLIGTPYLPSFDGAILLIEEIDERPEGLDRMIAHLALSGEDQKLGGLVLGQFTGCTPRNEKLTEYDGLALVWEWARSLAIPVLAGFPYGHEGLATTVPVGSRVRLDWDPPGLTLLEKPNGPIV